MPLRSIANAEICGLDTQSRKCSRTRLRDGSIASVKNICFSEQITCCLKSHVYNHV